MGDLVLLFQLHLRERLLEPLRQEDGVPAKHVFPLGRDYLPWAPAYEQLGLWLGRLAEGVDALGVAGLVFEALEQVDEALSAYLV